MSDKTCFVHVVQQRKLVPTVGRVSGASVATNKAKSRGALERSFAGSRRFRVEWCGIEHKQVGVLPQGSGSYPDRSSSPFVTFSPLCSCGHLKSGDARRGRSRVVVAAAADTIALRPCPPCRWACVRARACWPSGAVQRASPAKWSSLWPFRRRRALPRHSLRSPFARNHGPNRQQSTPQESNASASSPSSSSSTNLLEIL